MSTYTRHSSGTSFNIVPTIKEQIRLTVARTIKEVTEYPDREIDNYLQNLNLKLDEVTDDISALIIASMPPLVDLDEKFEAQEGISIRIDGSENDQAQLDFMQEYCEAQGYNLYGIEFAERLGALYNNSTLNKE